jgi:hypothetical protein
VLDPLPDGEFCAAVATANAEARTREDELVALVQAMREAGGVTCGDRASSVPAPALLRHRASLRCAARVLAAHVDRGAVRGLLDSSGRETRDRLAAAGYADSIWAEAYAVDASSATDALAIMLTDERSCVALTREGYADVGTGSVGAASVVTLAAE